LAEDTLNMYKQDKTSIKVSALHPRTNEIVSDLLTRARAVLLPLKAEYMKAMEQAERDARSGNTEAVRVARELRALHDSSRVAKRRVLRQVQDLVEVLRA
jgi:hypothetical protein